MSLHNHAGYLAIAQLSWYFSQCVEETRTGDMYWKMWFLLMIEAAQWSCSYVGSLIDRESAITIWVCACVVTFLVYNSTATCDGCL